MLACPVGYRNSRILVENPKAQKLNRKTFMFNKTVREPQAAGKIKGFVGCFMSKQKHNLPMLDH